MDRFKLRFHVPDIKIRLRRAFPAEADSFQQHPQPVQLSVA